jgi:asparagine synthase (glutamine-hydrolysing)
MRSDVPIGACLSGGLDSSAIVCTLADIGRHGTHGNERLAEDWQRAFIATFPDTPVDERSYADLVIQQTGVQPEYVTPTPADFLAHIDDVVYHLEGLDAGLMIQLWVIYRRLRECGVVVTLDGHGGDELLGGYPHYTIDALYDAGSWPTHPRRYLELLDIYRGLTTSPADAGPRNELGQVTWDTHAWLRNLRRLARRAGLWFQPAGQGAPLAHWLGPTLVKIEAAPPTPSDELPGASLLRRTLYRDFHSTVLPVILRNYDRLSMAHGVEVRMPFLDWRLVTFAFSLPDTSLLGQGYTKLVLRRAMRQTLPPAILNRRDKIGFSLPMSQWLSGEGRRRYQQMLDESGLSSSALWNGAAIQAALAQLDSGSSWNQTSAINTCLLTQVCLRQLAAA